MGIIELPGHQYWVHLPGIESRPEAARKIIPVRQTGTALELDLKRAFGYDPDLLARFAAGFWDRVDVREATWDGCWDWDGATFQKSGYGRVGATFADGTKKILMAHRVAYALANEMVIPEGVLVCRSSGCSRLCCRPTHLWLGDYHANPVTPETAA